MKRQLCGVLACLLLLSDCAGGTKYPTDDAYHPETDCQWTLVSSAAVTRIAEGDGVIYSLIGYHLYATSTETWVTVPVCSRPDCDHDWDDPMPSASDCEAFFPDPSGVFTADGSVYVLYKSSHYDKGSGIVRERCLTQVYPEQGRQRRLLSYPDNIEHAACVHRGKFYCARAAFSEDGTGDVGIYRYDLMHPSKDPALLYGMEARPRGGGGQVGNTVSKLFAWGSHLYFSTADEEYRVTWYAVDLNSGEVRMMPTPEGAWHTGDLVVFGGGLLLSGTDTDDYIASTQGIASGLCQHQLRTALDGTDAALLADQPYLGLVTDGKCLYGRKVTGLDENGKPTDLTITITDAAFSPVDTIPEPAPKDSAEVVFHSVLPLDGDWVLTEAYYSKGTCVLSRFPKSQIGTGQITPEPFLAHWHGQVQE